MYFFNVWLKIWVFFFLDCKVNLSDGERLGMLILLGGGSLLGRIVLYVKFVIVLIEIILYKIYKYVMMYIELFLYLYLKWLYIFCW